MSVISVFSLLNVSKKFRVSSFRVPGSSVQPHPDANHDTVLTSEASLILSASFTLNSEFTSASV